MSGDNTLEKHVTLYPDEVKLLVAQSQCGIDLVKLMRRLAKPETESALQEIQTLRRRHDIAKEKIISTDRTPQFQAYEQLYDAVKATMKGIVG